MDPLLVLFGFGVGILVGTTGMGGGSLMTPLLILLFGIKPVVAVGVDVPTAVIIATPFVLGAGAAVVLHGRDARRRAPLAIPRES